MMSAFERWFPRLPDLKSVPRLVGNEINNQPRTNGGSPGHSCCSRSSDAGLGLCEGRM